MWGLVFVLGFTTALLCYAGYIFLIVDKRQESAMLADTDIFEALDDKNYDFELPEEIDEYEELRESQPGDKCAPPHLAIAAPQGCARLRAPAVGSLRACTRPACSKSVLGSGVAAGRTRRGRRPAPRQQRARQTPLPPQGLLSRVCLA